MIIFKQKKRIRGWALLLTLSLLLGQFAFPSSVWKAEAADDIVFSVCGDGVIDGLKEYTLDDLKTLDETEGEYTYKSLENIITDTCKGVLLEKVLEDAGVTDPDVEIDFITTDGFEYGVVSLQTAREQAYLVTYLVNEAPFLDEDKYGDNPSSTIRIYRNHNAGTDWRNRMTLITGAEIIPIESGLKPPPERNWTIYRNDDESGIPFANLLCVTPDGEGGLWVGTNGAGAAFRDLRGEWYIYDKQGGYLPHNMVTDIKIDRDGGVWFAGGSQDNGMGIVRKTGMEWTVYNKANSPLPSDYTSAIAFDDQGGVWLGTGEGPVYFDGNESWTCYGTGNFPAKAVTTITLDDKGGVWFGFHTENAADQNSPGGYAYLDAEGEITSYRFTGDGRWARSISFDRDGGLWVCRFGQVDYTSPEGDTTVYETDKEFLPYLSESDRITMIEADGSGGLWVGTMRGGLYYRDKHGDYAVYNRENTWPADAFNYVWYIKYFDNGELWIATNGGVAGVLVDGPAVFTISVEGMQVSPKGYTLDALRSLKATEGSYAWSSKSGSRTDRCKGVLLADLLADAGFSGPDWQVKVVATDGFDYGTVSLREIVKQEYLVTYQVNGEIFEDMDKSGGNPSPLRIYRRFNDGEDWRNRLTLIGGVSISPSRGDITGKGRVTVNDAILILRHIVGLIDIGEEYGPDALGRARVAGKEGPGVNDAILVLRYVVGLIEEFTIPA